MINIKYLHVVFFILFLIIILILLFKSYFIEKFVSINSNNYIKLQDTNILKDQLQQFKELILFDFKNSTFTFDKSNFALDINVIYYYNDVFQQIVLEYINLILNKSELFKDYDLKPIKNLTNIIAKDVGNNRHFIFNIELFSKTKLFKANLEIYLIVENMISYLDELKNYQKIIKLPISNIKIANISVLDPEKLTYSPSLDTINYKPLNNLYDYQYYYNILTKLHIMDGINAEKLI